ncbi:MAG: flavin reductase family protein [Gemmatimonadaceae bacterium]
MSLDPAAFRSVLGRFASGVTVVTARNASGEDHGITVSAFCSLSLEPPLVLICVEHHAEMHAVLGDAAEFAVNVLAEGQESLARRFADRIGNRFDGLGLTRGITGAALLDNSLAHIECKVTDRRAGGDHTIFLGEVISASAQSERPLLYYRGGYAQMER